MVSNEFQNKKKIPEIHLAELLWEDLRMENGLILIHIGLEKDTLFIARPFEILLTNIRVISAKDIDLGEYSVSERDKKIR